MIKSIMGIVAVGLTLWLVWYEFGSSIFENITFMVLILMWSVLGFILFLDALGEGSKKTSDEKIDELIQEMRLDREQRAGEVKSDGE